MATLIATLTPVKLEPYMDPKSARTIAGQFVASQTIPRGTILGQVTASSKWTAYNDALTNGTEKAKGIAVYDMVIDSSGNVIYGPSGATVDLVRGSQPTGEIYWKGNFLQSQLAGLDAAAIVDFGSRTPGVGATASITIG